jgi:hypothetical protein
MLRIVDYLIKEKKIKARLRTTNDYKELQDAQLDLEKSGTNDNMFAYETIDGKRTGNLNQDRDYAKFHTAKQAKVKELQQIVSTDPDVISKKAGELDKWELENTEVINGVPVPKRSLYPSAAYEAMNDAQRKYLDTVIKIKRKKDKQLPKDRVGDYNDVMEGLFLAPQVTKSLVERLKGVRGISDLISTLKDSWNDAILEREDEDEMGQRDET